MRTEGKDAKALQSYRQQASALQVLCDEMRMAGYNNVHFAIAVILLGALRSSSVRVHSSADRSTTRPSCATKFQGSIATVRHPHTQALPARYSAHV